MDETDAHGRTRVGPSCALRAAQELCQVRKIVVDDVSLEMRELTGFLVRRERCAETKAEIVARRQDRMEKDRDEEDEAECEANL